ncbi:SixA phosphatase family protein [Acetobacterium bakii]|uniref:Phosphohistidine phosphatase n=1 Tax=Acetobacterium bakii TaxID=52689 RepID=A0A0L6U298_9FIRM|nr:histidine phosphatase family protein [Acetobacterium bakii]KNZ41905.1 hypothetical protein AKG39_09840 [Acetobacterium bakii]
MELLLVRHGTAEEKSTKKPDRERRLTPAGILQLEQDMPYLADYLKGKKKVNLWSSGMDRAIETALIIKELGEIPDIEYFDFIETGDFYELEQSIKKMDTDSTIIIVGHEPHLSQWSYLLSRKYLDLKKGSVVVFEIYQTEKLAGEILWSAKPGKYKDILIDSKK